MSLREIRIPFLFGLLALAPACSDKGPDGGTESSAGTVGASGSGSGAGNGGAGASNGGSSAGGTGSGGMVGGVAGSANGGTTSGSGSGGTTSGASGSGGTGMAGSGVGGSGTPSTEKFSFFVTSLKVMVELSKNENGFGGDLRYGETGAGAGLRGADKICKAVAEKSMPGNGKTWRAFLSATAGEDGKAVNAIERIGEGPWYDRVGRLIAMNKADLANTRPVGADAAIKDDLPNEDGVPNHEPDVGQGEVDNHDILTGTNEEGKLFNTDASYTCNDWTSSEESGRPHCGHSWPRMGGGPFGGSGDDWMSALNEAGCAPGVWIVEAGPPGANGTKSVGDGGGYGGIYCFALTP